MKSNQSNFYGSLVESGSVKSSFTYVSDSDTYFLNSYWIAYARTRIHELFGKST